MSLIDDPKAWILRLFEMEESEGRWEVCETFPSGASPSGVPLLPGELVYGIYKEKYYFTPVSFIWKTKDGYERIRWGEIVNCSSSHGDGKKNADITLVDGGVVRVRVGDLAVGWSGRISQLFHQMIQKWGAPATLGPEPMSIDDFFRFADDDRCFAPNLDPHPTLLELKQAFLELKQIDGVVDVLIHVIDFEDGIPNADGLIVVMDNPAYESELRKFAAEYGADGIADADSNIAQRFSEADGGIVKMLIWD